MPKAKILRGDCRAVMRTLAPNSVHAIVTDPPAGIAFMGKDWDSDKGGRDQWVTWMQGVAEEAMRVLKPGGHALVWALPRTSHWTATAWENAGFEVRDRVAHVFGSGFPKSLDVSKAVDKAAGAKREVVGLSAHRSGISNKNGSAANGTTWDRVAVHVPITAPATAAAREWQGWGTALKPSFEDWWLLRKPLSERTVAANVLRHGTGGLNIDGCRVGVRERPKVTDPKRTSNTYGAINSPGGKLLPDARWPSHLLTDGSAEVTAAFPVTGASKAGGRSTGRNFGQDADDTFTKDRARTGHNDAGGSAARFFQACPPDSRIAYFPKPSRKDRDSGLEGMPEATAGQRTGRKDGSKGINAYAGATGSARNIHPTVKSTALMRYLCRLVTPPGGTVLDCFAGSGSTGRGAVLEGFDFIGVEQDPAFAAIARRRIAAAQREAKAPAMPDRAKLVQLAVDIHAMSGGDDVSLTFRQVPARRTRATTTPRTPLKKAA